MFQIFPIKIPQSSQTENIQKEAPTDPHKAKDFLMSNNTFPIHDFFLLHSAHNSQFTEHSKFLLHLNIQNFHAIISYSLSNNFNLGHTFKKTRIMQTLKNFTRLPFLHSQSTSLFSTTKGKICITTPIFYVNSEPHIGHLYSMIYTDAIAKWKRIDGYNVIFSTGIFTIWLCLEPFQVLMSMARRFRTPLRPKTSQKSSIATFMRIDLRI